MKLPKEITTVTPLSKYLAMILFITLPFIGFFLGIRYQQTIPPETILKTYPTPTPKSGCYYIENSEAACPKKDCGKILICPTPTPIAIPTVDPSITANWKTYTNTTFGYSIKIPNKYDVPSQTAREKSQFGIGQNICIKQINNNTCNIVIAYWQKSLDETIKIKLPTDQSQPKDFVIKNIKGKMLVYKIGESTTDVVILIPKLNSSNETISISYSIYPADLKTSEIYDQILSTFQFTP